MNAWSRSRKRIVLLIVAFIAIVLVGVPVFFLFHHTPTCSDGIQNGDETGIDCGGGCQKLCSPESLPIVIQGDARVLTVATSTYEVAALFENPNQDARITNARYTISLYSGSDVTPVKAVVGSVYVPKGAHFAVFEGPFSVDGAVPTRAILTWDTNSLIWEKDSSQAPNLMVGQTEFSRLDSAPKLTATVTNNSPTSGVKGIDLTALIFDADGNITAASKTFIDSLDSGEQKQAIFTWPAPFVATPVQIEILTSVIP